MAVIMLFDCGPAKARESLQGVGEPARCRRATTLWTEVLPLHTLGAPKARQEGSLGKGGQGERTEPAALDRPNKNCRPGGPTETRGALFLNDPGAAGLLRSPLPRLPSCRAFGALLSGSGALLCDRSDLRERQTT
jgi:hypothetical protein